MLAATDNVFKSDLPTDIFFVIMKDITGWELFQLRSVCVWFNMTISNNAMGKIIKVKHPQFMQVFDNNIAIKYDITLFACPLLLPNIHQYSEKIEAITLNRQCATKKEIDFSRMINLTELNLPFNDFVQNESVACMTNLTKLDLSCNGLITDIALLQLTNITALNIGQTRNVTDNALLRLTNLVSLDITSNYKITDNGIKNLHKLTYLNLCTNDRITDEGIKNLCQLMHLDVSANRKITDLGIKGLTGLTYLDVSGNNIITIGCINNLQNLITLAVHFDYWENGDALDRRIKCVSRV